MKQRKSTALNSFSLYSLRYPLGAFGLSAIILCIIYVIKGIAPFGDNTILKVDLYHQYATFMEELRSRVVNGQSLIYSWEGGMGKDLLAQIAYYSLSPFTLLIFLFPEKQISEALALIISLKICLCSATFTWYLKKHFRRDDLSVMIFGLLYGFCSFISCYYWNVMWLDAIYLFPVLAFSVEKLVHENRHVLYYSVLTLTILTNFYMAVLVCIFITLYFLIVLFSGYKWKTDKALIIACFRKFVLVSLLSGLSTLFILYPTAIALSQTKTSNATVPQFAVYSNALQVLINHFLGSAPVVLAKCEDLPNIYSGVFPLLLLPAYYFSSKVNRREKYLVSGVLIFMLLCCCIKPLDFMVHGFHFTANLPHRFT